MDITLHVMGVPRDSADIVLRVNIIQLFWSFF